jgi:hypothetical protein
MLIISQMYEVVCNLGWDVDTGSSVDSNLSDSTDATVM